jgi:ferredoxin
MGALYLPEARPSFSSDPSGEVTGLRIDCWRVPDRLRANISVPCLGALDAATLLRFEAGERPIELLDRGWCENCPAGGKGPHPAQAALEATAVMLKGMGMAETLMPRIRQSRLSSEVANAGLPDADAVTPLSRRAFFGRLAAPVQQGADAAGQPRQLKQPTAPPPHPSLARQRMTQAMKKIAEKFNLPGHPVSLSAGMDEQCRNHQGCTRVCPTGALQAYEEANGSGVRFAASACIQCGLCEQHCPEQAIRLDTSREADPADAITLSFHAQRTCHACGNPFTPTADDPESRLCDPCGKSHRFAKSMFQQLFGTHA